jgi:hypothetical protein
MIIALPYGETTTQARLQRIWSRGWSFGRCFGMITGKSRKGRKDRKSCPPYERSLPSYAR